MRQASFNTDKLVTSFPLGANHSTRHRCEEEVKLVRTLHVFSKIVVNDLHAEINITFIYMKRMILFGRRALRLLCLLAGILLLITDEPFQRREAFSVIWFGASDHTSKWTRIVCLALVTRTTSRD